jgi:hypothetical protein
MDDARPYELRASPERDVTQRDEPGEPTAGGRPRTASTDLLERRLSRLRDELEDAGVQIDGPRAIELLREIDRARSPRRHERRFPSYGAIVSGDVATTLSRLDELGAVRLKPLPGADPGVRAMADGVQAFAFVRPDAAEIVLLASPVGREIELVRLRRSLGPATTLVCRTDDAVVRVYRPGETVIFDGTRWWTKPDARNYGLSVRRAHEGVERCRVTEPRCAASSPPRARRTDSPL